MSESSDEKISRTAFDNCLRRRASPSTEGEGGEEMTRAIRIAENVLQSKRSHAAFAVTLARALLSSPDARREALEEAAKVCDAVGESNLPGDGPYALMDQTNEDQAAAATAFGLAAAIRALKETKP